MIQVVILFECGAAMHWGLLVEVMLTPSASLAPPERTIHDKESGWVCRDEKGDGMNSGEVPHWPFPKLGQTCGTDENASLNVRV
jgi:hypothetical protein